MNWHICGESNCYTFDLHYFSLFIAWYECSRVNFTLWRWIMIHVLCYSFSERYEIVHQWYTITLRYYNVWFTGIQYVVGFSCQLRYNHQFEYTNAFQWTKGKHLIILHIFCSDLATFFNMNECRFYIIFVNLLKKIQKIPIRLWISISEHSIFPKIFIKTP